MNDEQIKHMVDRFLGWKLPEDFNPDGGISFKPSNEYKSFGVTHVVRNEPSGTNLFDATQAEAMIRFLVEGLPSAVEEAIRKDRTALFIEIDEMTDKVAEALRDAPYKLAAPAMRHLEAITAAVSDPLGDHFGNCILCEEPIFVRGQPDDDCESAGDEYCHRTCGDKWRKEHPGERSHVQDDGGE